MEEHDEVLEALGIEQDGLFFRHALRPKDAWAASGEAVNRLLKRVVAETAARHKLKRPSADCYSSHSLRRGGAQFLRDAGVSRELIKAMGRLKSDAVDAYLDTVFRKVKVLVAKAFAGRCV